MATSPSITASSSVFHGDDPEQTTDYRTLSVLAIISLILGLISPVAVAAPFLLVVPFIGIAVSLLALRRIAVSGGVLAGRWAATIGLVLSIASAVVPISKDFVQRSIRVHQAEDFGRDWVAMVTSGHLKQAFGLTVDANQPQSPPTEPGAPPKVNPYDLFVNQSIIKSLQAAGANADIRIRETLDYQATTYRSIAVRQLYAVTPATSAAGAGGQPIEFVLSVRRGTLPRENMSRWMVYRIDPPNAAAGSPAGH
jgi:hypothetical protein